LAPLLKNLDAVLGKQSAQFVRRAAAALRVDLGHFSLSD
jgi:hypothetical protein